VHYYSVSQREVLNGGKPTGNQAAFVSQDIPELIAGDTVRVRITMANTGQTSWTRMGQFKLGSRAPADNENWGIRRVELSKGDSIVPGAEKTFIFDITVPESDGVFVFQWQMVQEGEEWFGAKTELKQVISGNPGAYLDACDEQRDWNSSSGLSLNTTDQKQGTACLEFSAASTDEFKKVFSTPYDSRGSVESTELKFWYYVSDVTQFESGNQVEIGSAGRPDQDEFNWKLSGLSNGWNLISLKTSEAGVMGSPDLRAINWFRIYHRKTGQVTTRLDGIQLMDPNMGPMYTLLVNSGTGGGTYFEAEEVTITANPVFGSKVFNKWVIEAGNPSLADSTATSTKLTMGAGSSIVSATYKSTVSMTERATPAEAIRIYPNPAHGEFSVALSLKEACLVDVSLMDLSGRELRLKLKSMYLNPGFRVLNMPLDDVLPGSYLIRITIDGQVFAKHLLIQ
jgi:hypothetical protein